MKLSTLAIGAAGGYAVCRAMEAKAQNVPLAIAFSLANLLKPIVAIRGTLPPATSMQASNLPQVIDVTPIT